MALLSVSNLGKEFSDRTLFQGVSFEVGERDKIGLVGDNGSGKTTLFRLLTGEYTPDAGGVVRSKETRLGYMEQHVCSDSRRTLWEEVESVFAPVMAMEREWERVNALLAGEKNGDAALIEQQSRLNEQIEAAGGLTYKSRVRATLLGLGFDEAAFSQPVSSLSGGQRSKAAMGRLLLSDTNLLLLDEPTNHLDIPSVEWLEEFLRGYGGAAVIISHDRYFLDKVTSRTLELAHGRLYASNGNYSFHKALREKEREVEEKHYKTATREIKRIEENIALLRQWNREKSIRTAESKQKMVDRMKEELVEPESDAPVIRFDFTARYVSGNEVINAENLAMGFPNRPLFRNVTFGVRRGQRVFLLGPNGCGKTTLLKILNGQYAPLEGSVRLGAKVTIGYYDQTQEGLNPRKTVIDEVWDAYPDRTQTEIRNALAAFLFRGDDVFKEVSQLSGGERARLLLLKLMLARDNLLLLDEPTNHLDIGSCEALEDALSGYDGTLFIVSHDRYFINRMADHVIRLTEDGCRVFPGNYDAYIEEMEKEAASVKPPDAASSVPPAAKVNDYKLRKEQESARRKLATRIRRNEEAIAQAEAAAASLHEQLSDDAVAADYGKVLELTEELGRTDALLEKLMEEWERLQNELEAMPAPDAGN